MNDMRRVGGNLALPQVICHRMKHTVKWKENRNNDSDSDGIENKLAGQCVSHPKPTQCAIAPLLVFYCNSNMGQEEPKV